MRTSLLNKNPQHEGLNSHAGEIILKRQRGQRGTKEAPSVARLNSICQMWFEDKFLVVGEGEDVGYSGEMRKERRAYQAGGAFDIWWRTDFSRLYLAPYYPSTPLLTNGQIRRFLPLVRIKSKKRGGQSKIKNSTRIAAKA